MAKATANYANSGLIKMQATVDGYAEGIALDEIGLLSEGSGQNLFLVRDNVVYTPSLTSSILQGITRDTVAAADAATSASRCASSRCRASSSTWRTRRSSAAPRWRSRRSARSTRSRVGNGKRGPVTAALQERFFGIIRGEMPDVHNWLTPVGTTVAAQ